MAAVLIELEELQLDQLARRSPRDTAHRLWVSIFVYILARSAVIELLLVLVFLIIF
jgi:hypothetical protein